MIDPGGLMTRTLVALLSSLLAAGGLSAVPVASLASLEGEVTVLRSGVLVPSEKLSDGFALEAFDTVATGAIGRADVRFAPGIGVAGSLRLDPGTSLYLEASPAKKEQSIGVELLAGSVSVRVSATVGASQVEVRTGAGTFFGPGPSFRVASTPAGDLLVTSGAGRVVCQLSPRTVFIEPGSVVQVFSLDDTLQTLPMNVSTLDAFEATWVLQRRQAFKDQATSVFRRLAAQYQREGALFQRAWDRYQREAKDDAKGVRAATVNLRTVSAPLERSIYQIRALRALYDEGGLTPSVELSRGYAAKDFFRQSTVEDSVWSTRLGEARGLYKQLADKLGSFPPASEGLAVTWATDYFH
jgi:hypothetical protein